MRNLFSHNLQKQTDLQIWGIFCFYYLDFLHTELRKAEIQVIHKHSFNGIYKTNFHLLEKLILQTSFYFQIQIFPKLCKLYYQKWNPKSYKPHFQRSFLPTSLNIIYSRSTIQVQLFTNCAAHSNHLGRIFQTLQQLNQNIQGQEAGNHIFKDPHVILAEFRNQHISVLQGS